MLKRFASLHHLLVTIDDSLNTTQRWQNLQLIFILADHMKRGRMPFHIHINHFNGAVRNRMLLTH